MEENLDFEMAFTKAKELWQPELKTKVPFYVLNNRGKAGITKIERRFRRESDRILFQYAIFSFIVAFAFLLLLIKIIGFDYYKIIVTGFLYFSLAICMVPLFYNYFVNSFAYEKKYADIRFSIYHWRNIMTLSLGYFGLLYIKPLSDWFPKVIDFDFSWIVLLKFLIFIVLVTSFIYTGLAQFKLAKTLKKIKPFLQNI